MYTKRNLLSVYNVNNIIKKLIACYVSTIIVRRLSLQLLYSLYYFLLCCTYPTI